MTEVKTLLGTKTKVFNTNLGPSPRIPKSQIETDNMADWLVDKLQSPDFRPLFLKAAWRIDRNTLELYTAQALELGKNPRAYFITLVKRDKRYYA